MPIANVCCGLLFLLLIRVPDTVFAGKHIVIRDLFNGIMSRLPDSCPGLNFYTYDSLLKASDKFPGFGTTGSSDDAKRELAAFLAHAAHETAGFCYVEEVNPRGDYCDESNAKYPCVPGKSYHGRGPLQLSWNYNYGAAGNYLELDVLNKPEIVAMNSTESFMTAVWFWMVDTSCHSAITSGQGFGVTIEAINSQECGGGNPVAVHSRIKYFKSYCKQLGVDPGSNLHCSSTPLQLGRSMKAYHPTNCIESPSTAPGVTIAYCQVAKTPAPTTDAIEGIQQSFQVPRHNQTSASANITVTVGKPTTNVASPVPSYIVAAPAPANGAVPYVTIPPGAPAPAKGAVPYVTIPPGAPAPANGAVPYVTIPPGAPAPANGAVPALAPEPTTDVTDSVPPHVTHSKRKSKNIAILLGIIGGSAFVISIACLFFIIRGHCRTLSIIIQRRKRYTTDGELAVTEESAFVRFDYEVLKDATKNFDSKNELGEGGFGKVYKGTLSNGTDIAVKKLFVRKSSQAMDEFLTEIKLISKLRHRNLVRLLGYCTKGHEQLLVYEFMPNGSLDKHLFRGHDTGNLLNWKARFEIIVGTAQGLAYLHEYSHARIIHRDIKAANILLDQKCHPKIADFGLARLFPEDQSHVSTGVGGTIGYMAPEYAVHGHLSEKADIYSYGVVVLEIVSGRKCKNSSLPAHMELLLEWAWSLYERDESMEIVDANLEGTYQREEVSRVIQIAFLCTQGSSNMRPSMSNVVSMLTSNSKNMVKPTQPALINANNRSVPIIAVPEPVPSQRPPPTSHGSISLSFTPR